LGRERVYTLLGVAGEAKEMPTFLPEENIHKESIFSSGEKAYEAKAPREATG
jgi:hypothetical protein